jgi:hypothetical protein
MPWFTTRERGSLTNRIYEATANDCDGGQKTWLPVAADVARSGDPGNSWGACEFRGSGPDGQPVVRHGKYVTI